MMPVNIFLLMITGILITSITLSSAISADAISIVDIDGTSSATPDRTLVGERIIRQFSSDYIGSTPVVTDANIQTFDSHFAWQSAQSVTGYGPANVFSNVAGFDLTFTVEDPLNQGYTLDAETLVNGYRTATLNSCLENVRFPYTYASGTSMLNVRLSVDGEGFGSLITPLIPWSSGGITRDTADDGIALNHFTTGSGAATLGDFVGTHTFTLRVSNAPSSNTTLNTGNNCLSENAARFGLNPTIDDFNHSLTPGPDSTPASDLGLFVTVIATANEQVPENTAPVAINDEFTIDEDAILNDDVITNDVDIENDPLTATLVEDVSNGTLIFSNDGTFEYTPNENYFGSDSFTYFVNDGEFDSNTATVTISIDAVNDAPVCYEGTDLGTIWPPNHKMKSIDVSLEATDVDGDNLSFTILSIFQDELVNGEGDGETKPDAIIIDGDTVEIRAERAANEDGRMYFITAQASDEELSCTGTFTISVPHDKKSTAEDSGDRYESTLE